ncbi:hypothetical protein OUZ56_004477 [Daphnia magna]|uniref:Uncharacterized protein n=1 Tax=Daphnia magna TaxID=35525 RepID=A0ABQ9YQ98_9CRUS|nr:hypothetical protein OUZ56_004477 [Daphnia magna]
MAAWRHGGMAAWRRRALELGSGFIMHVRHDVALHVGALGGPVDWSLMIRVHSGSAWVPQEGIAEHSHRAK